MANKTSGKKKPHKSDSLTTSNTILVGCYSLLKDMLLLLLSHFSRVQLCVTP